MSLFAFKCSFLKMVFESIVVELVNRFLGDYIENLDRTQLKLSIWGGVSVHCILCLMTVMIACRMNTVVIANVRMNQTAPFSAKASRRSDRTKLTTA